VQKRKHQGDNVLRVVCELGAFCWVDRAIEEEDDDDGCWPGNFGDDGTR
jgi:hypothetical protein